MTKTRKGFLKAGAIIGIISAILGMLFSFLMFAVGKSITEEKVVEWLKTSEEFTYVEENNSYYFIGTDENGTTVTLDEEATELTTKVIKYALMISAGIDFAVSIPFLILSIKLLSKTNKGVYSKRLTVSTLVLSAIFGELIVLAFMIIAMCSKNKNTGLENYEQITIQ